LKTGVPNGKIDYSHPQRAKFFKNGMLLEKSLNQNLLLNILKEE
jgi:hypothetical protein